MVSLVKSFIPSHKEKTLHNSTGLANQKKSQSQETSKTQKTALSSHPIRENKTPTKNATNEPSRKLQKTEPNNPITSQAKAEQVYENQRKEVEIPAKFQELNEQFRELGDHMYRIGCQMEVEAQQMLTEGRKEQTEGRKEQIGAQQMQTEGQQGVKEAQAKKAILNPKMLNALNDKITKFENIKLSLNPSEELFHKISLVIADLKNLLLLGNQGENIAIKVKGLQPAVQEVEKIIANR